MVSARDSVACQESALTGLADLWLMGKYEYWIRSFGQRPSARSVRLERQRQIAILTCAARSRDGLYARARHSKNLVPIQWLDYDGSHSWANEILFAPHHEIAPHG